MGNPSAGRDAEAESFGKRCPYRESEKIPADPAAELMPFHLRSSNSTTKHVTLFSTLTTRHTQGSQCREHQYSLPVYSQTMTTPEQSVVKPQTDYYQDQHVSRRRPRGDVFSSAGG